MSSAPSSVMRPSLNVALLQDASAHFVARFVDGHLDAMLAELAGPPSSRQSRRPPRRRESEPLQLLPALRALETQILVRAGVVRLGLSGRAGKARGKRNMRGSSLRLTVSSGLLCAPSSRVP